MKLRKNIQIKLINIQRNEYLRDIEYIRNKQRLSCFLNFNMMPVEVL